MADLRILYANQIQNLLPQIEGVAKYVPTILAERHIITEIDGVLALNAATYKVNHAVKFVVLDDVVIVGEGGGLRVKSLSQGGAGCWARCWCWTPRMPQVGAQVIFRSRLTPPPKI